MKTPFAASLASLFLFVCGAASALPIGVSGAWYNPDQAGHGISVQRVSLHRALVFWYTGDPDGNPLTLYIEAETRGESLIGPAYDSRGIRFGAFDPIDHRLRPWGTVEIAFDNCQQATLRWVADGEAGGPTYGEGEIALTRLAAVAGAECRNATVPAGEIAVVGGLVDDPEALNAKDGTLWAFEYGRNLYRVAALIGEQMQSPDWHASLDFTVFTFRQPRFWPMIGPWEQASFRGRPGSVPPNFVGEMRDLRGDGTGLLRLNPNDAWDLTNVELAEVAGDYRQECCTARPRDTQRILLNADGRFTGDANYRDENPVRACALHGHLDPRAGSPGEFDAFLTIAGCGSDDGEYFGRAWHYRVHFGGGIRRLRMLVTRPTTGTQRPMFAFEGFQQR